MLRAGCCFQEMVDWFNAIRAARFHYLQVAFPGAGDEEVRRCGVNSLHQNSHVTCTFLYMSFIFLCGLLAGAQINPELYERRLHGENGAKGQSRAIFLPCSIHIVLLYRVFCIFLDKCMFIYTYNPYPLRTWRYV